MVRVTPIPPATSPTLRATLLSRQGSTAFSVIGQGARAQRRDMRVAGFGRLYLDHAGQLLGRAHR